MRVLVLICILIFDAEEEKKSSGGMDLNDLDQKDDESQKVDDDMFEDLKAEKVDLNSNG